MIGCRRIAGRHRDVACNVSIGIVLTAFLLVFLNQVAAAQAFKSTNSMSTARGGIYEFTLTRLADGKVLAAGGSGGSGPLASVELYDPATGTWTPTGSMITARNAHTATLLLNGKVLVTGGIGVSGRLNSAELYDPVSGTWSSTGSLSVARRIHTALLLNNGKVLIAGGVANDTGNATGTASTELYDPATGTWSPTDSLAVGRYAHASVRLADGRALVAGGTAAGGAAGPAATSAEVYDPATGTWSTTGSMITGRWQNYTLTRLLDGKVLHISNLKLLD